MSYTQQEIEFLKKQHAEDIGNDIAMERLDELEEWREQQEREHKMLEYIYFEDVWNNMQWQDYFLNYDFDRGDVEY